MTEPTKEQLEECELEELQKEIDEINKESIQWRDEAIANLNQEIKTLKEQLAEAVDVIRKCRNHNYLGGEAFLDRITEHFLEKQDKENKDEK